MESAREPFPNDDGAGGQVARVFRFIDMRGTELHTIKDPQGKLPIPKTNQLISIGQTQMLVESVALNQSPNVYDVYVRTLPADH
jgi:hypothetical protein